jgi:ABC-type transport system substrate-binding protein
VTGVQTCALPIYAALRAGEVDVIATGLKRAQELKNAGFVIRPKQDSIFLGMTFLNYSRPDYPTHNKKVREALISAINKKEIVDKILLGQGKLVGSAAAMFTWAIEYKPYPPTRYDPKLAKKLLADAGYPDGFSIDIYSFVTNLPEAKVINEAIAGYWGAIGVKARILEMDYSAFKPYWTHQKDTTGAGMFMYPYANRPVYSWRVEYHSSSIYGHAKDPRLDKMIEEFENTATSKQYIAAAQGLMDYVLGNSYATAICTTSDLFATNKTVPAWDIGRGAGSYRWEYVGAKSGK